MVAACGALAACGRFDFDPIAAIATDAPAGCTHTFCDNFDRPTGVAVGWTSSMVTGGTLAIDNSTSVSPPGSLAVAFDASNAGVAYLSESFTPLAQTGVHYAFDLDLETADTTGEVDIADLLWLSYPAPCTGLGFFVVRTRDLTPAQLVLQETYNNCAGGNIDTPIPVASSGFSHLDVDVQVGAAGVAHVQVAVDGVLQIDRAVQVDVPPSQLELRFGVPFTAAVNAPWSVHYDNVAVDLR